MPCQAGVAGLSPGPRRSRCRGQGLQPQGCTRVNPPETHGSVRGGRSAEPRSGPTAALTSSSPWGLCPSSRSKDAGSGTGDTPSPGDEKGRFGVRCGFCHRLPAPAARRHGESRASRPGSPGPGQPRRWEGARVTGQVCIASATSTGRGKRGVKAARPHGDAKAVCGGAHPVSPALLSLATTPPQPPLLSRAAPEPSQTSEIFSPPAFF